MYINSNVFTLVDMSLFVTSFIKNQKGWIIHNYDLSDGGFCFISVLDPKLHIALWSSSELAHTVLVGFNTPSEYEYEFKNISDLILFLKTL